MSSMSPLGLVQERVDRDLHYPWRVLVCCSFMTRTTKEQARPALSAFFAAYPTPQAFWKHTSSGTRPAFMQPLGLVDRRWRGLTRMTEDYLDRASPYECRGVGPYARDALDLFCAGLVPAQQPHDHYLGMYAFWRTVGGQLIQWDEAGFLSWTLAGVN